MFLPGAHPDPTILLITMMYNIDEKMLDECVLETMSSMAKLHDATRVIAWGLERDDPADKRWMEHGAEVQSRVQSNQAPHSFCWYGPEGAKGEIYGAELWSAL